MKQRIILSLLLLCVNASSLQAADLWTVYQQAVHSDPAFKVAYNTFRAAQEQMPIAQAKLLPDVDLNGSLSHTHTKNSRPSSSSSTQVGVFKLTLSQPLFDLANWRRLDSAKASVKAARAAYAEATQDLILRVSKSYFKALEAQQVWVYSQSQARSLNKQLQQTQQRFQVGLVAITEVQEAKAQYDLALASELTAYNNLTNALENLRTITGKEYTQLNTLPESALPLQRPVPNRIDAWVSIAQRQNYSLLAARYAAQADQEKARAVAADRLPTVSATGTYTYSHFTDKTVSGVGASHVPSLGVSVDFPAYSGGGLSAAARQAVFSAAKSAAIAEQSYRQVLNATRKSFLGVLSGIIQVRATQQAVLSNKTSLRSMQESYRVGTKVLTDVLRAQVNLYDAQKNYAEQQYNYLIAMLDLKKAAGTLAVSDLKQINQWIKQPIAVARFYRSQGSTGLQLPAIEQPMRSPRSVVLPRNVSTGFPQKSLGKSEDTFDHNGLRNVPAPPLSALQWAK